MVFKAKKSPVSIEDVRQFWNEHPLCADAIPYSLGSPEYFRYYNALREMNESPSFSAWLHEYRDFSGRRVLDIGCGNGYVLEQYARAGAIAFGIDLSQAAVALSRTRFTLEGVASVLAVANVQELPFRAASFDCVSCVGVLHHTPDPRQGIQEILRVLKPGGRFILMVYHRNSVLYRLRFGVIRIMTGKSLATSVNEVDGTGNPRGDVYSKKEIRALLRDFEGLDLYIGLLQPWMVPKLGRFIPPKVLAKVARRWGWFLYVKATKPDCC